MASSWFKTKRVNDYLYITAEDYFFAGNRANIWLVKGPAKDVVIDTGLGVCNLRDHLQRCGLISASGEDRPCEVICTHVHFDHSGGAHDFDTVHIHEEDLPGLRAGRQTETLNYVKSGHFHRQPYDGFSAMCYKVPATPCLPLRHGDSIDLGGGHQLDILYTPGHTKGSVCIYYPQKGALFSGDVVYECGDGAAFLDWLPNSCVRSYTQTAGDLSDWIGDHEVTTVYPGHFNMITADRCSRLLQQYIEAKESSLNRCCTGCMQTTTWTFFLLGCFRCCPCG